MQTLTDQIFPSTHEIGAGEPVKVSGDANAATQAPSNAKCAKPKVLYVDPLPDGHHHEFLAFFRQACAESGLGLDAWVPEQVWRKADGLVQSDSDGAVLARPMNIVRHSKWDTVRFLEGVLAHASAERYAAIIFGLLDPFLLGFACRQLLGRKCSVPWSGVVMRDSYNFPHDEASFSAKRLYSVLKRHVLQIATRNGAASILTMNPHWTTELAVPAVWMPGSLSSLERFAELAVTTTGTWPARQVPPKDDARLRLLSFGVITPRKGLVEFCRGLLIMEDHWLKRIELKILGGMPANGSKEYVAELRALAAELNARGATVEFPGVYASEVDINQALNWCDAVVASYIGHVGSSAVVTISAQYGRYLIAQSSGQIGPEVRENEIGVTLDVRNPDEVASIVRQLLDQPFQLGGKADAYRRARTYSEAMAVIKRTLCDCVAASR